MVICEELADTGRLRKPELVVINDFYAKTGAREGAQQLLSRGGKSMFHGFIRS